MRMPGLFACTGEGGQDNMASGKSEKVHAGFATRGGGAEGAE